MINENTPAVKDPKEFQERLDAIKAGIQSKKESEAFALPKDEEEIPTPEELNEESQGFLNPTNIDELMAIINSDNPAFDFTEESLTARLAFFLRDESFFPAFGKWMKSIYFPFEVHEFIFEHAKKFYDDNMGLLPKEAVLDAVHARIKKEEHNLQKLNESDREINLKPWRELPEELYSLSLTESLRKYVWSSMKRFLLAKAAAEEQAIFRKETSYTSVDESNIHDRMKRLEEILKIGKEDEEGQTSINVEEFLKIEFPPKKVIIHPWLKERSAGMIAGQMGSGKTFLGVTIANGVTTGTAVGNWIVENPIPCVYVDGELEHRDMQDRLRNLGIGKRIRKLHLISDAFNVSANLPRINNLLDPNQQAILFKICEKCKDNDFGVLLILDNISVLCPGIDENKKSDWDPINVWLLDLKKSGVNSLYDHHTGKSGDQRGTSAHEDNLDTSIQISLPKDYRTEDGCRFNLHFKKKRVDDQYLHLIRDEEWRLNTKEKPHQWEITTSTKKSSDEIFLMLAQGIGVTEVAKSLKISHSYVSKIKNKLTANGYFNIKGDLTDKGKQKLNSLTQDDDLEDE